jgi:hypothetical protein
MWKIQWNAANFDLTPHDVSLRRVTREPAKAGRCGAFGEFMKPPDEDAQISRISI